MSYVLLGVGLAALIVGGELLVRGATDLAARLRISPLVIGLTVVAIGSSLPELAVGIDAAVRGYPGLVTGNIVGTNIVNLLLILGLCAAMRPILTQRQMMRLDTPAVAVVAVLLIVLSLGGSLNWHSGLILLGFGLVYTVATVWYARRVSTREPAYQGSDHGDAEPSEPVRRGRCRIVLDVLRLTGGMVLVILGAEWLVSGAVDIATALGVSDVLIGLTIVAIGTSAPELVTAVVATLRGQPSIAVGNLIGSSVYNILFILGLPAVVAPGPIAVPADVLYVDMIVMAAVSLLIVLVFRTGRRVSRFEGIVLVAFYLGYLAYLMIART